MSDQTPETDGFLGTDFVIHAYTLDMAVADGVLVPLIPEAWASVSAGVPIVVTSALHEQFEEGELIEVYNAWVEWFQNVRPTLPEEEQMFSVVRSDVAIWVIYDGSAITILRPEDY